MLPILLIVGAVVLITCVLIKACLYLQSRRAPAVTVVPLPVLQQPAAPPPAPVGPITVASFAEGWATDWLNGKAKLLPAKDALARAAQVAAICHWCLTSSPAVATAALERLRKTVKKSWHVSELRQLYAEVGQQLDSDPSGLFVCDGWNRIEALLQEAIADYHSGAFREIYIYLPTIYVIPQVESDTLAWLEARSNIELPSILPSRCAEAQLRVVAHWLADEWKKGVTTSPKFGAWQQFRSEAVLAETLAWANYYNGTGLEPVKVEPDEAPAAAAEVAEESALAGKVVTLPQPRALTLV